MSQHTQPEAHLLNSSGLLRYLLEHPLTSSIDENEVKQWVFLSHHEANRFQPDHVLDAKWRGLLSYRNEHGLRLGPMLALERLSKEFLEDVPQCRVKLARFGYWQTLMTRISSLPMQAWHCTNTRYERHDDDNQQYQWPVYPHHPYVEDYISHEQLHETHQHLNGSTTAEDCWLETLSRPVEASCKFQKEYQSCASLRQLCIQLDPSLDPVTLLKRLQLANCIRGLLCRFACDQASTNTHDNDSTIQAYWGAKTPLDFHNIVRDHGKIYVPWPTSQPYTSHAEFALFCELLEKLKSNDPNAAIYERLLWVYLLIQNQYLSLLVQRDDFYGFDQFQKYTLTELRDLPEKIYTQRFLQAHGNQTNAQTGYLEGRFAPKKTPRDMEGLLTQILSDYCRYLHIDTNLHSPNRLSEILKTLKEQSFPEKAKLALVAHFIKKKPKNNEFFPYQSLYRDLTNQAGILLDLLKRLPLLTHWLRGIDAAANEMDTPPEVFAPLFRILKQQGIPHATFHVGEDFPHLVSGIRAIDDALQFLPLDNGDRLGHCTAIGIAPALWRRSFPPTLELTQETYLLDQIFIWQTLRHHPAMLHWAHQAQSKAIQLAQSIFQRSDFFCIEMLSELFAYRDLYPLYEPLLDDQAWCLRASSDWDSEYLRVEQLLGKPEKQHTLELYRRWLTDKSVRAAREKTCVVETQYLPDDVLITLQQSVMKKMVERNIAIECPPTSNTRISQYHEIHEHHVFRWMGLPEASFEGDHLMSVCLASDDPGIFVTDLKSEFYHLFLVLMHHFQLSAHEALSHVAKMNENGRRYRFHSKTVF